MSLRNHERLRRQIERQSQRLHQAERDRPTLLAQASHIGVLGLLLVLPTVGGAYLGLWLDEQHTGYSSSWTLTLIILGLCIGIVNVYYFVRARE